MKTIKYVAGMLTSVIVAVAATATDAANEPLRVLSVGNSFSANAHKFIPKIVESMGRKIIIHNADISAGSMTSHVQNYEAYEKSDKSADSKVGRPYGYNGNRASLSEILCDQKWDVVTIQQFSGISKDPESYEPAGTQLIEYIKSNAPSSKIVVYETWAYRADESRIVKWEITTDEMYASVTNAYRMFAASHGLEIIPAGEAFQLARKTPEWGDYTLADKEAGTDASGKTLHASDGCHAGVAGEYLLGCVWYEFLFEDDVRKCSFLPEGLDSDDGAILREIAHKTMTGQRDSKKP